MQDRRINTENSSANNDIFPLERLREMTDYKIASTAPDYCFIGRAAETVPIKKQHPGRILHPEARGEKWNLEKNMAFMAGAIEAGKDFLIVTRLDEIAKRAKRGLTGQCYQKLKLGYTTAEILCLVDNGYRIVKSKENHPGLHWALAPEKKVENVIIKKYGELNNSDVKEQVERICKIAEIETPSEEQARRLEDQERRRANPRFAQDSWGRTSGGGRTLPNRSGNTFRFYSTSYNKQGRQVFFNDNQVNVTSTQTKPNEQKEDQNRPNTSNS